MPFGSKQCEFSPRVLNYQFRWAHSLHPCWMFSLSWPDRRCTKKSFKNQKWNWNRLQHTWSITLASWKTRYVLLLTEILHVHDGKRACCKRLAMVYSRNPRYLLRTSKRKKSKIENSWKVRNCEKCFHGGVTSRTQTWLRSPFLHKQLSQWRK